MFCLKRGQICGLALLLLASTAGAQTDQTQPVIHQGVAVTLKVNDFESARQQVISAAEAHSGKLADSKVNVSGKGRKSGWMRIIVPTDQLRIVLPQIYGLGTLYGDRLLTSDQTSNYELLARRMGELDKHEQRLNNVLNQPRRMRGSDILYLQERLFRAGIDQQSLAQTRLDMARQSGSATIILNMFEPIPVKPAPKLPHTVGEHIAATFSDAWISFRRFGLGIVADLAFLLVYAVVWVPLCLIGWLLGRWTWRRIRPNFFPPDKPLAPPATPA